MEYPNSAPRKGKPEQNVCAKCGALVKPNPINMELLEACESLIDSLMDWSGGGEDMRGSMGRAAKEAIDQGRKAIAKVEGEQ